jgi:hypothetical protein
MVSKLKRLPMEWEKIIASYKSEKGLITRLYSEIKKLHFQKINDTVKKWANELNSAFSKEEVQMANKHMKKCLTSLAEKEMKILLECLPSRTQTTTNVGKAGGKL